MATTYNRRINLYINVWEVCNDITCMRRMKDSGSSPPVGNTHIHTNTADSRFAVPCPSGIPYFHLSLDLAGTK